MKTMTKKILENQKIINCEGRRLIKEIEKKDGQNY